MQTARFALTKIQPPRARAGLIARHALEERLARAIETHRLVLLSAPAGFGKTAALTRQLSLLSASTALAWIALDEDDDLGRVASCLVAALEPYDLPWRASPDALIQTAQDGTRESRQLLVAALLNALAAADTQRGLIVFDDAHRVTDPAVFELLDALVERLPAHWCVLVASRMDPPLALARLRAHGELAEFRQEALTFAPHEVEALAHTRSPELANSLQLHERTQGWPAGLSLLLSAPRQAATGNLRDRHVFDYLASEVLAGTPEALRLFLLRSSVLPELSADTCRAVTGDVQAAFWLDEIERRGLFASVLSGEPFTLKLHDLFRDFLEDRLRRELPDELPALLTRAAEAETDHLRRMGHLLRAGAWQQAEHELTTLAPELLTQGAIPTLLRLVSQFPPDYAAQSAAVQLARTLAGWAQWDWPSMREAGERAIANFARLGDEPNRLRALSYTCVAYSAMDDNERCDQAVAELLAQPLEDDVLCRALLVLSWQALPRGDFAALADAWRRLITTLEHSTKLHYWYEFSPLPSFIGLPGMREPLLRYAAGAQRHLPEHPVPLAGMLQVLKGWLYLWAGDWHAARQTVEAADADNRWLGRPTNLDWQLLMLKAMVFALAGDVQASRDTSAAILDAIRALPDPGQRSAYIARLVFYGARVATVAGDVTRLRALVAELDAHLHDGEWVLSEHFRRTAEGYVAHADGDLARACALWGQVLETEERADVYGQAGELRVRRAAALASLGRLDEAALALRPVFTRLAESSEVGPALTAGPQALQQLADTAWAGRLSAGEVARLHACAALAASWRAAAADAETPADQPAGSALTTAAAAAAPTADPLLSPREREVLQRIAAGDSNKLIARAFDLSPHTVKRHVANILDKLGLSSRGQAAAWWREHAAS